MMQLDFGGRNRMLKRKIQKKIEDFFAENPKKALLVTGARQVGKRENWIF